MILTDREIQIAIENKLIIVDPLPDSAAYSSTSLDLTLDPNIRIYKENIPGISQCIDTGEANYNHNTTLAALTDNQVINPTDGYDFQPGRLLLAWTLEFVELRVQARIAARVEGKSSLARLGISVHNTAPTIHAGFKGQIQLEMINHGKIPIKLRSGMKICQLIFEQTIGTPVQGYIGRFAGQTSDQS